jgi:hypothetical protein
MLVNLWLDIPNVALWLSEASGMVTSNIQFIEVVNTSERLFNERDREAYFYVS